MDYFQELQRQIDGANKEDKDLISGLWAKMQTEFPDRPDGFIGGALYAQACKEFGKALVLWSQMRDCFPYHPSGYLGQALVYCDLGDFEQAEAILAETVERFPLLAPAGLEYARIAGLRGDSAEGNRRVLSQYHRLMAGADHCRQSGNQLLLESVLGQVVSFFTHDIASAVEYAGLAGSSAELRRRWCAIPAGNAPEAYYEMAWQIIVNQTRAGGEGIPLQTVAALLSQPWGRAGDKIVPKFLHEWFVLLEGQPDLAKAIAQWFEVFLSEGQALNRLSALVVLCMGIEVPGVDRLVLLANHIFDEELERLSLIFSTMSKERLPGKRNLPFLPGLIEAVLQSSALDRISPRIIYNWALLLLCVDQLQSEKLIEAAVTANPPQPDLREPLGVLGQAFRERQKLTMPAEARARLKIALCIAGQLRDYRSAFPSWDCLGLEAHDTDSFVHTWVDVGSKPPVPAHADRIFKPHFAKAYQKAFAHYEQAIYSRFPGIFIHFMGNNRGRVDEDVVRRFYNAKQVVVEDEAEDRFAGMGTPHKMYYKIQSSFDLAKQEGTPYDLVIRIRTDLNFRKLSAIDWHEIYRRCHSERLVFNLGNPNFMTYNMGLKIGDVFAVGNLPCMELYSYSAQAAQVAFANQYYGCPRYIAGHVNFAYELFVHGIRVESMHPLLDFTFSDAKLEGEELLAILLSDMGGAPRDAFDRMLIEACYADQRESVSPGVN